MMIKLLAITHIVTAYLNDYPGNALNQSAAAEFKACVQNVTSYSAINLWVENEQVDFYISDGEQLHDVFRKIDECMEKYGVYLQLVVGCRQCDESTTVDEALREYQPKQKMTETVRRPRRGNARMNVRLHSSRKCSGNSYAWCNNNFDVNSCVTTHTKVSASVGYDNWTGHDHHGMIMSHHDCRLLDAIQDINSASYPKNVKWHKGNAKCMNGMAAGSWWIQPNSDVPYPVVLPGVGFHNPVICFSN